MNEHAPGRFLLGRSVEVIRSAQAPSGGYVAAPTYATYRYVWVRDGSFIAEAMRTLGHEDSSVHFHSFVAEAVLRVAQATGSDAALLPARFLPDGSLDQSDWPNFQLDGYGLWLWSLERHPAAHSERILRAAEFAAKYLSRHWRDPCHDPWEEGGHDRPTSTLMAVMAGLGAANRLLGPGPWQDALTQSWDELWHGGVVNGYLTKNLGDPEGVDAATLWAIAPLGVFPPDDPVALATVGVVEERLGAPGVHRHLEDTYYGGGAWPVLSALWGLARLKNGDRAAAERALAWIESVATPSGDLPEQTPEALLAPAHRSIWEKDRGPVATPLIWSHAMYLLLMDAVRGYPIRAEGSATRS